MRILIQSLACFSIMMIHTRDFAAAEPLDASKRLKEMGAEITEVNGVATKVSFTDCSKLGDHEFQLLGQLEHQECLTLHGQCKGLNDRSLHHVAKLRNLVELSTDGIQVTDQGIAQLKSLANLKSLKLFHLSIGMKGFDGHGIAALKDLPNLQSLTIAGTPFNDHGMAAVAELSQLREFRTWHTYQTQAGNEFLTKLPNLRSLWLGQRLRRYDRGSNALSLDDSTFNVIVRLKELEFLRLDEARISLTALRRLKDLPRLKKLDLARIDISTSDIELLKTELPSVAVNWNPLTEAERSKLTAYLQR